MSEKFYTLDNHRQLQADEIIRKGDLYKNLANGRIQPVKFSIKHTPGEQAYIGEYNFYRRLHIRKPVITIVSKPITATVKIGKPKVTDKTPRFPEVKFAYPSTKRWGAPMVRHVKVISLDDTYLVGLEVGEDNSHQFKRFLRSKIRSDIQLLKF